MLGNKKIMAKNISRFMKENNVDRKRLSKDLGVKYTTLSDWINAKTYPRIDKIELLADYFNITKADLVEDKDAKDKEVVQTLPVKEIPIVSQISAGLPIYAEENILEHTYIATKKLNSNKEIFGLRVNGDSMDKEFRDGDVVIVEKDAVVENGQIAVVQVNGYNATVKRVRYEKDRIILIPESNNPAHYPQVYSQDDEVKIIGKVVSSQKFY